MARDPVAVKQRIAVVPQRPNLDRAISAIENLTFHGAYFGWSRRARRARAHELLEQFGLEGRGDDRVNDYSGGMAQRLMIARALMHEPRLLFLDEPTTGLDPQARLFLWDQIEELRDRGVTVLLTTHDMTEADRLCRRIAIMDHGQVIALDTPRGLRRLLPDAHGIELTVGAAPGDAFDVAAARRRLRRGRRALAGPRSTASCRSPTRSRSPTVPGSACSTCAGSRARSRTCSCT